MKIVITDRGFPVLEHPAYTTGESCRLVQESSAVGGNPDAFLRPGSSFLWVGERHHLNREEVAQLVACLRAWVETGSLEGKC